MKYSVPYQVAIITSCSPFSEPIISASSNYIENWNAGKGKRPKISLLHLVLSMVADMNVDVEMRDRGRHRK